MTNTQSHEDVSPAQIILIFVLLGLFAAGIPLVLRAFSTYVTEAAAAQNAINERIAASNGEVVVEDNVVEPTVVIHPGQAIYENIGCNGCHTLNDSVVVGPGFQGLGERAGSRVSGLSAEEYIRQSILQPSDYLVEGFTDGLMPQNYEEIISEEDLETLIEFLLEQ